MKTSGSFKKSFFLSVLLFIPLLLLAQSPKLVSYQAVVRDASNNPKTDTEVSLIMTVNQGSASGTQVYSETHTVTTNNYGLINVQLGGGSDPVGDFSTIDWSNSPYYLNISVDGAEMDPVQLVSVPYAIYADQAGNVFSGDYNDLANKPVLSTSNWNEAYGWGDHALAGYLSSYTETDPVFGASPSEGISSTNITNWNTAYSWGDHSTEGYMDSKWMLNGSTIHNPESSNVNIGSDQATTGMLTVTSDISADPADPAFQVINQSGFVVFEVLNNGSVNINIEESGIKGPKGGFAIGGFDPSKGLIQPYLSVSPDSTRLYFNEDATKGPKGGFAIGGFNQTTKGGSLDKYVEVRGNRSGAGNNVFLGLKAGGEDGYTSTSNVVIGNNAGLNLNFGSENNVFIGQEAGMNASVFENVFIGTGAGKNCNAGYNNVYIGHLSGSEGHGQYNVFIGNEAGRDNDGGYGNVFMGDKAGVQVTTGDRNVLFGTQAGQIIGDGNDNVIIGFGAGGGLAEVSNNTYIGSKAGKWDASPGNGNLFVGFKAGNYISSGTNNIILGSVIGPQNGSGNILIGTREGSTMGTEANNLLLIDNSIPWPLTGSFLHGDMLAQEFTINAYTGIRTAPDIAYGLKVSGNIHATGTVTSSDARMKHNVMSIADPLSKVLALRGVVFNWNSDVDPDEDKSMGFIAQEAKEIIPEMIFKGSDNMLAINYAPLTALLVEAIKELKKENDELKAELSRVDKLEKRIDELSSKIGKK